MPELPEVETVRQGCAAHLLGRRLTALAFRRPDLRWPIPIAAARDLRGRRCTSVERRSKYLLLSFDGPRHPVALIHLGMSGRLYIDVLGTTRASERPPPWELHEHWRMRFGDRLLRYQDARRFGVLDVTTEDELPSHRLLSHLGPEPLEPEFTGEWLFCRGRKRHVGCKNFLMDARNVVGIGNIYASEACFRAGIRPRRQIGRVTRRECDRLAAAVRDVLGEAVSAGGTTLRDYVGVDRSSGWFQRRLRVYGRAGEPCPACRTPIVRVVDQNRSTYYCQRCQS